MTVEELVSENKRRNEKFTGYDPLIGIGAPLEREWIEIPDFFVPRQYVPKGMLENELVRKILEAGSIEDFLGEECTSINHEFIQKQLIIVRSSYDFCFWAYMLAKIKPKSGGSMVRFNLNYAQRYLVSILEELRLSGVPIRVILLKARQWGGSTLVQIYMAWIQLVLKTGWYSTIVAQTLSTSRTIKAMYSKLLEHYPSWMLDLDNVKLEFSPYEGSASASIITYGKGASKTTARDTVINVATYENPDATRGTDAALIHYSEVAIWSETEGKKPEDLIRSISGGLLEMPLTMEVMESTANGTGNFFHREWERAKKGESNRKAVFVPWYYIEHDTKEVKNQESFARWLLENKDSDACPKGFLDSGKYYWYLWELGATFEGINWYRHKRKGFNDHGDMASEAPSDDVEAFKHSGTRVFDIYKIANMRKRVCEPIAVGELHGMFYKGKEALDNITFTRGTGNLKIWAFPDENDDISDRYLVIVDVGGRSNKADFSVVTVIDRFPMMIGGKPEIVARWRGHADHDIIAWKAAQIAKYYNNALLVIESNTLETKDKDRDTDGLHTEFILDQIAGVYKNLYYRRSSNEDIKEGEPRKWGFHTNTSTKPMIIDHLIVCVREESFIEKDDYAYDEFIYYEKKQNGSFGAISGQHDDVLMTLAIGLYICMREMKMPKEKIKIKKINKNNHLNEAVI